MRNVKTVATVTQGNSKRMAITFDEVDEDGKVINSNRKTNRVVMDNAVLEAIKVTDEYAQKIVDSL